jgi:hypothetical protein
VVNDVPRATKHAKMPLTKRGKYRIGESQSDLREKVLRYCRANEYVAHHFADALCTCGGAHFKVLVDDVEGAAVRTCATCGLQHPIGDSDEYLEAAELEVCACPCGVEEFEVTVGVSLYDGSEDVRWLYLGCRCPGCGLVAVYGDWKNEYVGYRELLARV